MGIRIEIAPDCAWTIHNIPFGVISTKAKPHPRCATAIGEYAIDLELYANNGCLDHVPTTTPYREIFAQSHLNQFAKLPREERRLVRDCLIQDIKGDSVPEASLFRLTDVVMHLPFQIGGYSDFYCSLEHVQNCSGMSGGPSIPVNWFHAPSVYNGRVSSVMVSGHPIRRPRGMHFDPNGKVLHGLSQQLDYELEMGYFVSKSVGVGSELDISKAWEHIFGFVLLNDWSARDLQLFEMKPLGPFHGKGFGTSISPWVVTVEALEPFRCPVKTKQEPPPPEHLHWPNDRNATFDIRLKTQLIRKSEVMTLGTSNLKYLYWTPFQQITHHASAGCGLNTGDLLGTGTISGDAIDKTDNKIELGCLYEATEAGSKELAFPNNERGMYLLDEDEIVLTAWCGTGHDDDGQSPRLGFGECRGSIISS